MQSIKPLIIFRVGHHLQLEYFFFLQHKLYYYTNTYIRTHTHTHIIYTYKYTLYCQKYWVTPLLMKVFGDEFLAQGLHLKSHQRCSAGIRTCLSADQSSSSTLTQSSFICDTCLIHRDTCHVRIEKGPVQIVAIKLEAHNSLEHHHYMLKY